MQRYYINHKKLWQENFILLEDKDIIKQITIVLRNKIWEQIIFYNWENMIDYLYEIVGFEKKYIKLIFKEEISKNNEIDFEINLFHSIPNKIEKIEYIIQKSSEVWISKIYFFNSIRSKKINLSDNKKIRFYKIMLEAIEQSWRNKLVLIEFLDKMPKLKDIKWENIYFHTKSTNSKNIENIDYKKNIYNLFIWAEWWWENKEIEEFEKNNFNSIYLWNRILRTETVSSIVGFYIINKKSLKIY